MATFSNVRDDQSPVTGTSPYVGPQPLMRDPLDALRTLWRRDPASAYPDGYVDSAINSRRADRTAAAIWRQQRSYTRGVHKGERLDMSDYYWPEEFNLSSAIMAQAQGRKFVSPALGIEPAMLTNDGKPGPRDPVLGERATVPVIADPDRAATLRRIAPTWS